MQFWRLSFYHSFNPLPSHEGRLFSYSFLSFSDILSIHFPLTREDFTNFFFSERLSLSIHFPLTREDSFAEPAALYTRSFNPLPSHEGRHHQTVSCQPIGPFNPLPSHEGRLFSDVFAGLKNPFNPLPSHEGRLQKALIFFSKATHFSDITNKNIASNKIAPYLKRFLRYKNLFFLVRTSRGINVRLWFAPCFRYRISHSLFKTITVPSHQIRILHQYAQSYFYIGLPDNKNAGCPYLCL